MNESFYTIMKKAMSALPITDTTCLGFTLISHASQVLHNYHQVDFNSKLTL